MSRAQWSRSMLGLLRAEARGAVPMALGLIVTVALLMLGARYQFKMAPEAMIGNRPYAWVIVALAAMVPLAAELFGSSGRALRAPSLQPLPALLSQVFVAKLAVLLGCVALAWLFIGASDLALDRYFPRTKLEAGTSSALPRLLLGTPVLALFITALTAATIKNALGSTLLGLLTLIVVGAAVVSFIAPPYESSAMAAWGLSAAHFAIDPLILMLALGSLAWASTLRGRASASSSGATLRRSVAALFLLTAAPVVALGGSAVATASSASLGFDDPSARIYRVVPSPDETQVLLNLTRWQTAPASSSWIIDAGTGAEQQVIGPGELARKIPFASTQSWATSWSPDGEALRLDVGSTLPWLELSGALHIRDKEFERGSFDAWSFREQRSWQRAPSDGYFRATERFRAASCDEAVAILEGLAPGRVLVPRRACNVIFAFVESRGILRIDGATGELTELANLQMAGDRRYGVDPLGKWVTSTPIPAIPNPPLVHAVTGRVMNVPAGWFPSGTWIRDMIVRDDAVLVLRAHRKAGSDRVDWAWLKDGVLSEVLPGLDASEIVDLDGDRMVAVSQVRQTVELLDREGRLLRTLRAPADVERDR